jgi:GAF domain
MRSITEVIEIEVESATDTDVHPRVDATPAAPPPPPVPKPPPAQQPIAPPPPLVPKARSSSASSRRRINRGSSSPDHEADAVAKAPSVKPEVDVAAPRAFVTPPPPPAAPASVAPQGSMRPRVSGDELIADLFQAMHELDFCADSVEAASFTLALAMEKLASDAGIVHLYDIDQREFVIVRAAGPSVSSLRGMRTSDADPLAAEALRTRGAVIVRDPEKDPRAKGARWQAVRNAIGAPLSAIACARAAQAGRFLGLLELCNTGADGGFEAGDEHALSYIAERFTEFVAAHGVMLGDEG